MVTFLSQFLTNSKNCFTYLKFFEVQFTVILQTLDLRCFRFEFYKHKSSNESENVLSEANSGNFHYNQLF